MPTDNYVFFKFDGISAQFSAVGPDPGDTGNENAEGIIRLESYVREELREDIFFNTTVGTWASPFWYQITDATWRQEADYGEAGDNSIDREKWITYRDRLVYQNYVTNSPICPINTLMTHGFILTTFGQVSKNMDYNAVLRELRCAFVCGSGMVELYNDYVLMNSINNGKLWEDLAECIAWQKKNADVLPDAHWVGGNPWTGSAAQVYGWASWNGAKATLALRNGANSSQTYTFTLREAFEIPANITGAIILNKSFKVQDALSGLTEGTAIDIDQQLTVTLPGSSVFAFDGVNADPAQVPFQVLSVSPSNGVEALTEVKVTFNSEINVAEGKAIELKNGENVIPSSYAAEGAVLTVALTEKLTTPGTYTLVIPADAVTRVSDDKEYTGGEYTVTVVAPAPITASNVTPNGTVNSLQNIEITFSKDIALAENAPAVELKDANENVVATAACALNGKVLAIALDKAVKQNGEFTLVIPEGVVTGKELGDAYIGTHKFVIDVYTPRNTGTRNSDRVIKAITLNDNSYTLTAAEQAQDYTDATATVTFNVEVGEELTMTFEKKGEWIHQYVFIDFDGDGFTASIESGSNWKPAEDLVAYSFYNNDAASDENGWNSVGTAISGNNRSTPAMPAFTAPDNDGLYRMRIKQDWCNIDPAGDADGKFNDFKANGGQIIDITLNVQSQTGIKEVETESAAQVIYDLTGRKVSKVVTPGLYIVNGVKRFVK